MGQGCSTLALHRFSSKWLIQGSARSMRWTWESKFMAPYPSLAPHPACGAALSQGQCPAGGWRGWEDGSWQHCSALICMLQPFGRVLAVCACRLASANCSERTIYSRPPNSCLCVWHEKPERFFCTRYDETRRSCCRHCAPVQGSWMDSAHLSSLRSRLPWAGADEPAGTHTQRVGRGAFARV